jgi:hypothetical protein
MMLHYGLMQKIESKTKIKPVPISMKRAIGVIWLGIGILALALR